MNGIAKHSRLKAHSQTHTHTWNTCISRITTANKQNITQFLLLLLLLPLLLHILLLPLLDCSSSISSFRVYVHVSVSTVPYVSVLMFISCAIALAAAAAFAVAQTTVNRIIHTLLLDINWHTHIRTHTHTRTYIPNIIVNTFVLYIRIHANRLGLSHTLLCSMFLVQNCLHDYFTRSRAGERKRVMNIQRTTSKL